MTKVKTSEVHFKDATEIQIRINNSIYRVTKRWVFLSTKLTWRLVTNPMELLKVRTEVLKHLL